jgi:hypothetical protein
MNENVRLNFRIRGSHPCVSQLIHSFTLVYYYSFFPVARNELVIKSYS